VDPRWSYVPVTGTIPNLRIYILDRRLRPVPRGVIGEAYIAGIGVGRGYLADPVKTASVYVPDPFAPQPGARMYKTGARLRYASDGALEVLGRLDLQVKVRGHRIEVAEIETALAQHPSVAECVVVAVGEPEDRRLVGYVTAAEGREAQVSELAEHL